MLAPAPGLFSITTCWPQTSESRAPTLRAMMSVAPPGTNGTMRRTKRVGQAWAHALRMLKAGVSTEAAERPSKQRRLIMGPSPWVLFDPLRKSLPRRPGVDKHAAADGARHLNLVARTHHAGCACSRLCAAAAAASGDRNSAKHVAPEPDMRASQHRCAAS